MTTLPSLFLPELGKRRRGSVRDIYEREDELILIASDRISCYDRQLKEQIPHKGRILTEIAAYWFEQTKDILDNHVISYPDPNILVAKRCAPLQVEVVVRGYLAGSLAAIYERGVRKAYGLVLPEGLKKHDPFPKPIVTPTTKNHVGHDEPTTPEDLVEAGTVTQKQWDAMATLACQLYERGREIAERQGLTLVDTKYEFGVDRQGNLILIDEIHTPDSSRYWFPDGSQMRVPDKQYVRDYLKSQGFTGEGEAPPLPKEIVAGASARYQALYEQLLGKPFIPEPTAIVERIVRNLKREGKITGRCVLIAMDSEERRPQADKIATRLKKWGVASEVELLSAHQEPERLAALAESYNQSSEPVVAIAVTGGSSVLTTLLATQLRWPVIASPHFVDPGDYRTQIHATLQLPEGAAAMTVLDADNAADAALRILEMAQ